jgi:hypothetical protein
MKLNGMDKILNDGRDFLMLVDYGQDGISVMGQYHSAGEALSAALRSSMGSAVAIVKLVDIPESSEDA